MRESAPVSALAESSFAAILRSDSGDTGTRMGIAMILMGRLQGVKGQARIEVIKSIVALLLTTVKRSNQSKRPTY